MGRKTSLKFDDSLMPLLEQLEAAYRLRDIIQGGVVAFWHLSPAQREQLIQQIRILENADAIERYRETCTDYRRRILEKALAELEVYRKSTKHRRQAKSAGSA